MASLKRIFVLIFSYVALTSISNAETLTLSREQCLEIALQESTTVKVADMEVKKVDYAKKETLSSLFPTIDFSGAYQRSIELQTIRMDLGGQSQNIKMGSDNTWNLGFSASLPIIAPTLWKAIDISDAQILSSLEEARASRLDLVNNVNKAYYALMLAIASKEVINKNYEIAKLNSEVYKKQFENGTASEYDVLRSSVQVKNIEPDLLQADIAIKQCQLQLKVLMGISDEVDIIPDSQLKDLSDRMFAIPSSQSLNLDDNTSLRTLEIQRNILSKNVQLKKLAWVPTIGASFNLAWTSLSNGSPFRNQYFNPYSNVGLALSVPIFSGGSKLYGLRQAQVQLKEIELQKEYLLNSLNMQVELAIDNMNREAAQISSSKESVAQANKAYDIMQKSFEIGAASYLDLRDAELANTSAQLSYLQSIYNYLISSSELDTLIGKENW
ncbi:MAG: TolC family protein [Muribaculaceae bacterium]|nr:TolC family protein [Muribaculaceae bacterium]